MDFAAELQKLLGAEEIPLADPLAELAQAQARLIEGIRKDNVGLSLQMEEVYDIIKNADENAKEVKAAAKREQLLLGGLVAVIDLLDGLLPYMREHAAPIAAKKEEAMSFCGLEQLGFPGERLDLRLHTVASAEYSYAPIESVIRVLISGYGYRGKVIRKATVILSRGVENE